MIFLVIVVVIVVVVVGLAASRPGELRVQRSLVMAGAPEQVFALVNDFRRWAEWSPYEKLDPAMQREVSGSEQGVGAVYRWQGNAKAGAGRMEIIESAPGELIRIKLDFSKPMEAHNQAEFRFVAREQGTEVSWLMTGPLAFPSKVFSLFVNLDHMIGRDFEQGLKNLAGKVSR